MELTPEQREALKDAVVKLKTYLHQDDPTITDLWEKDGLCGFTVNYTDEQIERFKKRPQRGYQIPFD